MSNKVKIFLLVAALGSGIAAVFNVVHLTTGGTWLASIPAALGAAVVARAVYWRLIARMTNSGEVVATGHGSDGRIDAIEVFWRPG